MNKVRFAVLAILLISLLFLVVRDNRDAFQVIQGRGESFIEGVRIIQRKDGSNDWTVTAKRADIIGNGDRADLSEIQVLVNNKGMVISADRGTYNIASKKLTVTGPITAKDGKYTIISSDVEFDNASGILSTDKKVTMQSSRFTLTGTGMRADNKEQKVRILKDVTATYYN